MNRKNVYVALSQFCQFDDRPRRVLMEAGFNLRENTSGHRLRREEMIEAIDDADAVLAGLEPYDAEMLARLPRLRCISRCGVGTDNIDLRMVGQRNIAVLTTDEEVVEPVAQMTVAMILALARNFPSHVVESRLGQWQQRAGYLLSEWTIGLIGFGRIGRAVERYLRIFEPLVLVADPALREGELPAGVKLCNLTTLLGESDLVSLHATRQWSEGPLLGRDEIRGMKYGGRLVNTARGYLVDEMALYEALISGHLAGTALDVYGEEPYTGPLVTLPQTLCTPHVASLTRRSRTAMELRCAKNVVTFFSNRNCGAERQNQKA
jgi:D-3-phosphoglycerate dehydrogenase